MSKTLYDSLKKYSLSNRSSFHTPGHKQNAFRSVDFFKFDYTELPETDNLYDASGIIKAAENSLAEIYDTKRSLFSCGGNTLCIQAMIRLCAPNGGKILCDRVAHRSAVAAMALLGVDPVWIERQMDPEAGHLERISVKEIETKLLGAKDIKAVYITSPDYYGILQDIKAIASVCRKFKIPLMVDNAHGSHLKFVGESLHPIDQGATMSADSAHKTLPVLTGGAWLHINDEIFCSESKRAMALFGSTSPSYSIMASMDLCQDWLRIWGESKFKETAENVNKVRELAKEVGIYIPDESISDPCRITLGVWKIGMTGEEFRNHLYKFKIEPEFCDKNYVVLIPAPFNMRIDWSRLKSAINNLKKMDFIPRKDEFKSFGLPKVSMSLREAMLSETQRVDTENAVGNVAAEIACPCPPGVPIVMPGENIGEFEKNLLINYGVSKINVVK